VAVLEALLCPRTDAARDFSQELCDGSVTANLSWKPTLKSYPLAISVIVALKNSAVPLYAGLGRYDCGHDWH
jgi:hypothetical protein